MDGILESPELKQTIKELPNLVSTLRHTLNTVDREVAGPSHGGSTFFEVPLEAATAPGVAAATADALGRLADGIATQAGCPGNDLAS